jgi:hypothetical protein
MAAKKQVVAVENFSVNVDGKELLIHIGEVVPASHKLVKGRKHLFEPYPAKPPQAAV